MPAHNPIAAYVYNDVMAEHVLREDHPLRPIRLRNTYDLLEAYGAFNQSTSILVEPRSATLEEVLTSHTRDYVEAVFRYSHLGSDLDARRYGFSEGGDNPIYPGMYQSALLSTGASVQAAELIADGRVKVAFNPSGGLHHASFDHASGFCVFNDPAIAINALRKRGLRVAYLDIDAHHGDGVQEAFYHDCDVLTISLHESGKFLFPGTGEIEEIGIGKGRGYSVNVPLFPFTDDELYISIFESVVPPIIESFRPDILVTQLGIDTHFADPLTHLALSSHGYVRVLEYIRAMGYPWLAFGGGGYDLDAVARCWALAYGVMADTHWPNVIPNHNIAGIASPFLHDLEPEPIKKEVLQRARLFGDATASRVRELIHPFHALPH